jgi:regulator of sigma E protease
MGFINFVWANVVLFLFVLTVLVFVHEMGHYWVARRNRVRVDVFSIGFGPEIYGWTDRLGTRWKISAVPLGGYVKMFGENDSGEDGDIPLTPEEREVSFQHKRLGQRAAVVVAGPLANYLFAIVVLAGLYTVSGVPRPLAAVGEVVAGSAAEEAGLRPGDRILGIDGTAITWFEDLRRIIMTKPGVRLDLDVLRDGARLTVAATPKPARAEDESGEGTEIGRLGVTPHPKYVAHERQNPLKALWMGAERSVLLTGQILSYIGRIFAGSENADQVGGPLRIAQMSGAICQGGLVECTFFMAALSINLGLINLFPIPMLDGGHLVYYIAEAIRGRPLGPRAQEYGFRFGLILVFLLMIFATWNDLVQLEVIEFLKDLMT